MWADFKTDPPRFDCKLVSREEYSNASDFVEYGRIPSTRKRSQERVLKQLAKIGYVAAKHHEYTFMYPKDPGFGPDLRHIKIKELNAAIALL